MACPSSNDLVDGGVEDPTIDREKWVVFPYKK
jgi:hypothetical protein